MESTTAYLSETEGRAVPTRPGEQGLASPVVRSMKSTLLGQTGETIRVRTKTRLRPQSMQGITENSEDYKQPIRSRVLTRLFGNLDNHHTSKSNILSILELMLISLK